MFVMPTFGTNTIDDKEQLRQKKALGKDLSDKKSRRSELVSAGTFNFTGFCKAI